MVPLKVVDYAEIMFLDCQIMLMSFRYLAVEKMFRSNSEISAKIFVLWSMTFFFL